MKSKAILTKLSFVLATALISSTVLSGCGNVGSKTTKAEEQPKTIATYEDNLHKDGVTPEQAENAIIEGNKRFVDGKLATKDFSSDVREDLSKNGQHPFATILTCSDSRVPPELIFDQGLGDLFVIRDAGNVDDSVETGSVEYAVEHAKTPLVVVMAHEKCGAVQATVEGGEATANIQTIIEKIKPSLDKVKAENKDASKEEIEAKVEDENAKETVRELLQSTAIKEKVDAGKLKVVAAKYDLDTGKVEFFN